MRQINPYAPSPSSPADGFPAVEWSGGLSSLRVCVVTIGAVAASGGLFGAGMVLFAMFAGEAVFPAGSMSPIEILPAVLFAGVGGALYAGVAAVIVVPLVFLAGFYLRDRAFPWSGTRVRLLTTASGFLTGAGCVVVPSMPSLLRSAARGTFAASEVVGVVLFSLVPATVGLVGTWVITEPMARRASREAARRKSLAAETAAAETVPLPGPEPSA